MQAVLIRVMHRTAVLPVVVVVVPTRKIHQLTDSYCLVPNVLFVVTNRVASIMGSSRAKDVNHFSKGIPTVHFNTSQTHRNCYDDSHLCQGDALISHLFSSLKFTFTTTGKKTK